MAVHRMYVEKREPYAVEAQGVLREIREILQISSVAGVRMLCRYDVEGLDPEAFRRCVPIVLMEPPLDWVYEALPSGEEGGAVLAVEYLPGQFDARAASCGECMQLATGGERPAVRTAKVYLLAPAEGQAISAQDLARIKQYLINPVEAREAELSERATLAQRFDTPPDVPWLTGFTRLEGTELADFVARHGLAMDEKDLAFCRDYFRGENRDPSLTEIRMIDTYWSDHCRHTTFLTHLDQVQMEQAKVEEAFSRYLALREAVHNGKDKPITLMDMATIGAKALKKQGLLPELDESEEINACSIQIDVEVDGRQEPWLLMFKNETHNHPTEIEPFGGAATCIGGAIRDPLSGRTYVYQAMRVTGASDPTVPVESTLPGKLPQRKLVTTAAAGYSAYGNQIGLATGLVREIYHPGYQAKRLEVGAVVGAAPKSHVRREAPAPGDAVILLGGRTGRDGCGGATGSSKSHTAESTTACGAEVQKGNPVVERKLQRLFRDPRVTRLIKRCNDFGAGGVSVAIGELADGLLIDLDKIPKKYEGLDGTELAISESQERMAVVVAPQDVEAFIAYAAEENLEATLVAQVTEEPRLQMRWRGRTLVDLSRAFLNSNGAEKHACARVARQGTGAMAAAAVPASAAQAELFVGACFSEKMESLATHLNICGQKGLGQRFDGTIGTASVLMPFGGKHQLTPAQAMVAKLPVLTGETSTVSGMAYGFHPEVMEQDPYEGAYLAVVESLAKLVATGLDAGKAYLTFQEYFPRMTGDPLRWGQPVAALLGALDAQMDYGVAAIGGKDSMSGSFEDLDVPPTLVSFAIAPGDSRRVISPEWKGPGHALRLLACPAHDSALMKQNWAQVHGLIRQGKVLSAWALGLGGVAEALLVMSLGNQVGAEVTYPGDLFAQQFGGILLELAEGAEQESTDVSLGIPVGRTLPEYELRYQGETVPLGHLQEAYEARLESVFPYRGGGAEALPKPSFTAGSWPKPALLAKRPLALIPAFPGTNCEVDTARAVERAGGESKVLLIRNLTPANIAQSVQEARKWLDKSQMLVLPGGFSGGDEPDGSAKFIAAFFRNPAMKEGVQNLLERRDGLVLGICNGFQALVKLGLLPNGQIMDVDESFPTLTYNTLGRHQSMLVRTRIASNQSPWLQKCTVGEIHTIAISHGEGRFVASPAVLDSLAQNGQLATQYVDWQGSPTMDLAYNPNGSAWAVEGITSLDGRVLGKMGHSERAGRDLYKNVEGNTFQPLFEGGVAYFR